MRQLLGYVHFMWILPDITFSTLLKFWWFQSNSEQKFAFNPVHFKIVNFLLLRYLWTGPGRKTCTTSSNLSNTTSISNFKSLSQTVREFWSRYHQKTSFR
jgi:hypothetical protein